MTMQQIRSRQWDRAESPTNWFDESVEYAVLGQLRVGALEHDLTPSGQRSRDLLAVLLTRRDQAVDPMVLLDLVWDDEATALDASVVHTVVARLRRSLGRDAIETTGRGYRLRSAVTDETVFGDLVEQAQQCRAETPARAIELLRDALALWRADRAYADITDHLVAAETGRLRERRSTATEMLAELLLERGDAGDLDELVVLADAFVAREPLLERAHELLMTSLWRAGRQAEALTAYEELRVLLRDELGVDPSASAARLHVQMLTQDPELATPPARSAARRRSSPPAPTTPLFGREAELAQVLDLLSERRLVVVTGLGGVGKSRLLSEVHARLDANPDRAFLDLATLDVADRHDLVEGLGRVLQVPLDDDDPGGSLVRSLLDREVLLMVDEAERSTAAVATVVNDLLTGCPQVRVLVASRQPLGVAGETLVVLEPLAVPPEGAGVEEVAAATSVRLLRTRIGDHAPGITFGDPQTLLLGRLARRADGLPLALELLAGYAGTHSLAELDTVLDAPNDLGSEDVGRPARHRTLRDTIRWSVQRLPDGHRRMLRRLGVFSGSFDLTAAFAVAGQDCPDVDRVTRTLVREGLIQARREDDLLLLRLPRAVRDLAEAELAEHDNLPAARARHRRWHAAERWSDELRNDALNADVQRHYADYVTALRTGLEDGDGESVGAVMLTLGRYWGFNNIVPDGKRWFDEVVRSELVEPRTEARIRVMRAHLIVHEDPRTARADLAAAIPALDPEEDADYLVTAFILRSLGQFAAGEAADAVIAAQRAVDVSVQVSTDRQADALGVLALAQSTVDPGAASRTAEEAWARSSTSSNAAARASVATNVALALLGIGRSDEALALFRRAAADLADDVPLFLTFNTGWAELACDDFPSALDAFTQVVTAAGESLGTIIAAEALAGAACAAAALARPGAAELAAGAAELVARTGLVMQPFQADLLAKAMADAPWSGLAWPESALGLGRHLAGLLRETQSTGGNDQA